MRTSKDYKLRFVVGNTDHGEITVPKGTLLTHRTAIGVDKTYHFVDDFSWVKPYKSGVKKSMLLWDLHHYGINVPKEFVDYGVGDKNPHRDE